MKPITVDEVTAIQKNIFNGDKVIDSLNEALSDVMHAFEASSIPNEVRLKLEQTISVYYYTVLEKLLQETQKCKIILQ